MSLAPQHTGQHNQSNRLTDCLTSSVDLQFNTGDGDGYDPHVEIQRHQPTNRPTHWNIHNIVSILMLILMEEQ